MQERILGYDHAPWTGEGAPGATGPLAADAGVLRRVFECSYDAIFVLDPLADAFLDANPRAAALLGYTRAELLALPVSAVHPDELPRLQRFAADAAADGDGRTHELSCVTRNGRTLPVEVSCARINLGGRACLVCVARDVSERKRLDERQRRDRERARRELAAAARIQESLLPHHPPAVPGLRTAWVFRPCQELAGDNLDILRLGERQVGLYVLDVSGHGVAAALLAVIAQRLLAPGPGRDSLLYRPRRGQRGAHITAPARVAQLLDRRIRPHLLPGQYLTLIYGVLDLRTREFRFASAGHWGPIHVPRRGVSRLLHARGFPVGVMEDAAYEEYVARLEPGDRLYLYSDGLPEAADPEGRQFDYPQIIRTLERHRRRPLAAGLEELLDRAQEWRGGRCLEDDVSVLAVEVTPGGGRRQPSPARRPPGP